MLVSSSNTACKKSSQAIPQSLDNYLKSNGVVDIQVDYEYSLPSIPDKKYLAVTATYNFSTAEGKPQKEYLGYILKLVDNDWKIDRNTTYTKTEQKAKDLLSGSSK
jgi:hypothetical protein